MDMSKSIPFASTVYDSEHCAPELEAVNMALNLILFGFLASFVQHSQGFSIPNTNATFQGTPQPFNINVDLNFISDVHSRVQHARAPVPIDGLNPLNDDGPILANWTAVHDFWVNEYNWTETQANINRQLHQFTTIVHPQNSSYNSSVPLHYVHHRSARADAIPFLFIHGWPGSFLEVSKIIDRLTNPPNASLPAFHVVAPSIPGFAFSPAPQHTGFGPGPAAHAFHALMLQLNYTNYVIDGGDFGGVILRYQAHLFPSNVISVSSNFWVIQPSSEDLRRLEEGLTTPDETAYIRNIETFINERSGYRIIQEHDPLSLAYALTDSPLGFAMWIYTLMSPVIDPRDFAWTPQDIITWAMMYFIQGPYGGFRFYKENLKAGVFEGFAFGTIPYVSQPVMISELPYDLWFRLPLDWAQRGGNVKVRNVHDRGGHFAAYERPQALAEDLWKWYGDGELSGTKVFGVK
ncbi:MAG: hypothetical protein M1821_007207 [Bathelium mastoideum]|nr:MAG: hypothetical protein M1821_007207 [Bathelium mastoideum]